MIRGIFLTAFLIIVINIEKKKYKLKRTKYIFSPHKVFIEAHRGANKDFFQNTMEAFKKAIEYNVDSIETDVWLTKDNELVLLHASSRQGNLEDYYNLSGNVIEMNWNELSKSRTIQDNLTMPRLSDLMKIAKNKIFIDLEIKDQRIDIVFPYLIKMIKKYNFFNQIFITSPFYEYYNKIQEFNKHSNKKLIFGFVYDIETNMKYFDFSKKGNTLNINWGDATKEVCDKAHENGMAVVAWIDINEEENKEMYKQLIENGVDSICCNDPKLAKSFIDNYYKRKESLN